jgi:hypothetical protein
MCGNRYIFKTDKDDKDVVQNEGGTNSQDEEHG